MFIDSAEVEGNPEPRLKVKEVVARTESKVICDRIQKTISRATPDRRLLPHWYLWINAIVIVTGMRRKRKRKKKIWKRCGQ